MKTAKQFQNELNVLRKEIHNTILDCIKRLLQETNYFEDKETELRFKLVITPIYKNT